MADPDEALIEAIAARFTGWQVGSGYDWTALSSEDARQIARAAYAATVEHLGLVEEGAGYGDDFLLRRLVSRWTEVDHGSE